MTKREEIAFLTALKCRERKKEGVNDKEEWKGDRGISR